LSDAKSLFPQFAQYLGSSPVTAFSSTISFIFISLLLRIYGDSKSVRRTPLIIMGRTTARVIMVFGLRQLFVLFKGYISIE